MRLSPKVQKIASTVGIATVLLAAWYAWHVIAGATLHAPEEPEQEAATVRTEVVLPDAKRLSLGIETESVELRTVVRAASVPGRLAYDETQHIEVRAATAGVITKMIAQVGDKIQVGQLLATINSPELGTARADEMQRAAELELAQRQANWDRSRAAGIRKLVAALEAGRTPEDIRKNFDDEELGIARETLLTAYNAKLLAQSLNERLDGIAPSGALPTKTVEERRRSFDTASAALESTMEQTLFDANRMEQASVNAQQDAERRWQIAKQKVTTLLGHSTLLSEAKGSPTFKSEDLSMIEVRAPKSGWIEQKILNENERVEVGTSLFVIADTTKLWLKADLRESQWSALSLSPGQELEVTSPALTGKAMVARVLTMGREVDPLSNAISLVAAIDNPYGELKPGLFVRVKLPIGQPREVLAIPEKSVTQHDGQAFVFVAHDDSHFERRDVKVSPPEQGWVEVLSGLQRGEKVASSGVFALKSELLLESEE